MQIICDGTSITSNRNFNYGDGCFTTMRVASGHVEFLSAHLQRLQRDAKTLMITNLDWPKLMTVTEGIARDMVQGVLKILICRGQGGRGYDPSGVEDALVYCTQYPMPTLSTQPLSVAIGQGYLSTQPMLAGTKHCNRLENVLFKQQANNLSVDDVICLDHEQSVVEATSANILWHHQGRWHIPEITNAGVAGILRAKLIESFTLLNVPFVVGKYTISDLVKADTLVLCNCVRHLQAVSHLHFPTHDFAVKAVEIEDNTVCYANTEFDRLQHHWQMYLSQLIHR